MKNWPKTRDKKVSKYIYLMKEMSRCCCCYSELAPAAKRSKFLHSLLFHFPLKKGKEQVTDGCNPNTHTNLIMGHV